MSHSCEKNWVNLVVTMSVCMLLRKIPTKVFSNLKTYPLQQQKSFLTWCKNWVNGFITIKVMLFLERNMGLTNMCMQVKFPQGSFQWSQYEKQTNPFYFKTIKSIKAVKPYIRGSLFKLLLSFSKNSALKDLNNIHLLVSTMFLFRKSITLLVINPLTQFLHFVRNLFCVAVVKS